MQRPYSIAPNMVNMPWLDKPTQITESELDDLETNYERMLETIRNDTFGALRPPQYNTNYINTANIKTQTNDNNLSSEMQLFDINNSEINESFERVRNELNTISETEESLISSLSTPIPNSIDDSAINVDISDIKIDDGEDDDIKNDSHNLSLPFMSPTSLNQTDSHIMLPPIFNTNSSSVIQRTQRRTQSEEQTNPSYINNTGNHNNSTNSINSAPPIAIPMSVSQSIPPFIHHRIQMQLNQSQSQILNNIGLPDSVTSSMMFTPSQSSIMSNRNTNSSDFAINNAPQRHANRNHNHSLSNRRNINISDSIFATSMANIIHGIQHDIQSDNNRQVNNNNINNSSTPINVDNRSNSLSLDAPRPQRRNRNRRAM